MTVAPFCLEQFGAFTDATRLDVKEKNSVVCRCHDISSLIRVEIVQKQSANQKASDFCSKLEKSINSTNQRIKDTNSGPIGKSYLQFSHNGRQESPDNLIDPYRQEYVWSRSIRDCEQMLIPEHSFSVVHTLFLHTAFLRFAYRFLLASHTPHGSCDSESYISTQRSISSLQNTHKLSIRRYFTA